MDWTYTLCEPVSDSLFVLCRCLSLSLSLSGISACYGLDIEVIISDPENSGMEGISCNSADACEMMKVAIVKQGAAAGSPFIVGGLDCSIGGACTKLRVDLGQQVTVEECHCVAGACDGVVGVPSCGTVVV